MKLAALTAIALCFAVILLAGCSTTKAPDYKPAVVGDSYCSAARKQSYSVDDTKETIDGIRRGNAGYAKRCEGNKGG